MRTEERKQRGESKRRKQRKKDEGRRERAKERRKEGVNKPEVVEQEEKGAEDNRPHSDIEALPKPHSELPTNEKMNEKMRNVLQLTTYNTTYQKKKKGQSKLYLVEASLTVFASSSGPGTPTEKGILAESEAGVWEGSDQLIQ